MSDTNDQVIDRGDEAIDPNTQNTDVVDNAGAAGSTGVDDNLETPEEQAAREAEEAAAREEEEKKKRIRIPKARFDEAMNKAREREAALQQKIADLENQKNGQQQQTTVSKMQADIESLQDKYEDLIMDGKKDEARVVRKEIAAKQDLLIEVKTTTKSNAARQAAIEDLKYDAQLANIEATHPELNPDSDKFDATKEGEVVDLIEAFIAKGLTRPAALAKAVKYVMGEPKAASTDEVAAGLRQQRAAAARERAAGANRQQPASTTRVGLNTDQAGKGGEQGIDIMKISQEKFAKLDEETKARLRGDIV